MIWTIVWIGWLAFLIVFDIIANFTPGATFSEHCRIWFKSFFARVILALFLIALYVHFIINWPVWPVIIFGSGIGLFIARKGEMFRWDQWFKGLAVAVGVAVISAAGPILSDGAITKAEWWSLLVLVLGVTGAWCKTHPPETWDGEDRRVTPVEQKK